MLLLQAAAQKLDDQIVKGSAGKVEEKECAAAFVRLQDLTKVLIEGSTVEGGIKGFNIILTMAGQEAFDQLGADLRSSLEALAKVSGGHPDTESKPWHDGLTATTAWAIVSERASTTLLKVDAKKANIVGTKVNGALETTLQVEMACGFVVFAARATLV